MIHRTLRLGRALLAVITMLAWFSISNHCVLGSLLSAQVKSSAAPMHCHGDRPAPAESGDEQTPCCKVLKAVVLTKINAGANQLDFVSKDYPAGELIIAIWQAHTHTLELDTGPPRAVSFSELVLQRSILAHAPPSLS